MGQIKLHKDGKKHFSEAEWEQIHNAFSFFSDKFNMGQYENIPVYVTFPEKIGDWLEGVETSGVCKTLYTERMILRFKIEINPRGSMHKIFDTIFHEMVHVLQDLRGDFRRFVGGDHYYKSEYYSAQKLANAGYKDYRNFPWEKEARAISKKLLKEWYDLGNDNRLMLQKIKDFWSYL